MLRDKFCQSGRSFLNTKTRSVLRRMQRKTLIEVEKNSFIAALNGLKRGEIGQFFK